jgi:SPP1 gp7 family putative phage head morphogenesis protein
MNKRQKEVIQSQLKDEEAVIKKLKATYNKALKDINQKIKLLQADELTQSKIYQIEYQKALKMQIKAVLDNMNANQYTDIQDYLKNCYQEGFLGTMYDLQGQGIPLVFPIDQNQVVKALVNDTKLSKSLYESLGFNVKTLQRQINAEISRGIANGYSYNDIARNIANKANMGVNKAIRIARTEGHRISQQATFDAQKGAKERGADIVKQWDSTMDKKTRPNHVKLDGQIREVDEPFEVNGKHAMYPAGFGVPHEDINCRCVMLQRARWALGEDETTKMNNETGEIVKIKEKDFESFKKAYNESVEETAKSKVNMGNLKDHFGDEHAMKIKDILQNAPDEAKGIWNKYVNKLGVTSIKAPKGQAFYSPYKKGITINLKDCAEGKFWTFTSTRGKEAYRKAYGTIFHEFGHNISALIADDLGHVFNDASIVFKSEKYTGYSLNKMLNEEANDYVSKVWKELKNQAKELGTGTVLKREAYSFISNEIKNLPVIAGGDIADMWEGCTKGSVTGYMGHGKSYWKSHEAGVEAFAEMFDATVNNPESLEQIKNYFPKSYDIFLEILKEMGQ